MQGVDEAIAEFLAESRDNLNQLDGDLLALEADPSSRETLARVFRTIHTIKGTCGFLGYSKLAAVTHAGEALLSRLRDRELTFGREIADGLLALVDAVRKMLAAIEASGKDGDEDHAPLIATLTRLQTAGGPTDAGAAREPQARGGTAAQPDGTIRVDVGLLDRLMTLVGELVLARNQILQLAAARRESSWLSASQRLNLITGELQEGVMRTRMQPIANVWGRLPRQVRDLSASLGKRVRLEMEGMETELDRSILEAIRDPITHLVRNALDHGIEEPRAREAAGKSPEGKVTLRASHEGGQVHIEIADDGAGVDEARVREEAVRRGLLAAGEAARLTEREAQSLIFVPGFSTAGAVTSVSGRGVGMDVVKTNVERIGGTVDIRSAPGRGTAIRLTLPLTLAIIPALIVRRGRERYALPQSCLLELVLLEGKKAKAGLEVIHGALVHRLRGRLIPIVHLGRELSGTARAAHPLDGARDASLHIVVLRTEGQTFGLIVEGIEDSEEIVVKPLGRHLRGLSVYAGATILGDGRVALILDERGLARRARVLGEERARADAPAIPASPEAAPDAVQTLLLFDAEGGGRMALPLSAVARLEEFPRAAVERLGSLEVVQYRSEILPLVRVPRLAGPAAGDGDRGEALRVVVYSAGSARVGLIVDRIHDIVEEPVRLSRQGAARGVLGSAIIQKRVTEVLDVDAIFGSAGRS